MLTGTPVGPPSPDPASCGGPASGVGPASTTPCTRMLACAVSVVQVAVKLTVPLQPVLCAGQVKKARAWRVESRVSAPLLMKEPALAVSVTEPVPGLLEASYASAIT